MTYETIKLEENRLLKVLYITIDRPKFNNAISLQLLDDLDRALTFAESDGDFRTVVLKGDEKNFCIGMDFKEASAKEIDIEQEKISGRKYADLLNRFASMSTITVSMCQGKVLAGGVGFVAASDIVIAHPSVTFGLSEAIWGLLPANVMPYLIRRVGFQPAYFMTLTVKNMNAIEGKECRLVDVVSEAPEREFKKLNQRLSLLHPKTVLRMKTYFKSMWIINDEMVELAVNTSAELVVDPMVQQNIRNYVENGKLPWE